MFIDYLKNNSAKILDKYSFPDYYKLKTNHLTESNKYPICPPELEELENRKKQLSAEYTKLNSSKPPIDYNRKLYLRSELQLINSRISVLRDIYGLNALVAAETQVPYGSGSQKVKYSIAVRHTPPNFDVTKSWFVQKLYQHCNNKKISDVQLYKDAQLSRQVFSKIRSMATNDYLPSKPTVINLCLALQLNLCETQELLSLAGYTLSPAILSDKIIAWCIEHNEFNVLEVAELLYDMTGEAVLITKSLK